MPDALRAEEPALVPRAHDGTAPTSFSQQRLWFLEQLEPGLSVNNIPRVVRLAGPLDIAALERALTAVVARHEVLRTSFAEEEGTPVQVIADEAALPIPVEDLRNLPESEREGAALARATEIVTTPFDLTRPPLLRARLLRLSEEEHDLVLAMHHIASDAWSIAVFFKELSELYAADVEGRSPRLPELPVQYADFAAWQREVLRGARLEEELAYWRERLAGAPNVLELPADRARPAAATYAGRRHLVKLPKSLLDKLTAFSRKHGVTLYMTLLAAFETLLSKATGQEDLLVGTPVAGRSRVETEGLIGFFVNTLVLRSDLSGDPPFTELLSRVRDAVLGALAHQELPFEKLVESLSPERLLSRSPLFQVMFNFQSVQRLTPDFPGVAANFVRIERGSSRFDLTLEVSLYPDGLLTSFEYASDLFDASTVERLADRYRALLLAVLEDPARRLSELPSVTEPERRQLLVHWNDTAAELPPGTFVDAFERVAASRRDAVAVQLDDQRTTYGVLDRRANRLARALAERGVSKETLVGIAMERSTEMLVALLAVQKAGGAYVPLDPSYPKERLKFMVEDSGLELLLTEPGLENELPGAARVLAVSSDAFEDLDDSALGRDASPDDLAYVIYTSGSTGRPKGVAVTQRGLLNVLASMAKEPGLEEKDVLLAVTTLSFDIAALELFLPLFVGGRVAIASREAASDAVLLSQLLTSTRATAMQATPATWRMLLSSGWAGRAGLKALCGGEPLTPDLAAQLLTRCGSLWNVYGPTETTIWSTVHRVAEPGPPVPIGRPIANTRVYVLDRNGRLAPPGSAGELAIGGAGLARGYWKNPELTKERFTPDPFGAPGSRLYRTGDLARFKKDGTLECLGRLDEQVKVRGFRVEPGEVVAALRTHPKVAEAAVAARADASGEKRLVAWIVPDGAAPAAAELRGHLAERLPDYMLPSAFVAVEALPRTPAGKLDVMALPEPEPEAAAHETFVAPRTATEETLAEIWSEVMRAPRVGVEENFFDLGGHSLLGTQVFSRIRERLGVTLPLRTLFERPTVAELAAAVDAAREAVPA